MNTLEFHTAQEEVAYLQDVMRGLLDLSSFNDDWGCFHRYALMQADALRHVGFLDLADVAQAIANRAGRKAGLERPIGEKIS